MNDYPEIDKIALTLIQATALLLPVVFLTVRFYIDDVGSSVPDDELERAAKLFKKMVLLLTVTGIFGTAAVFDLGFKDWLAFIAVSALMLFFVFYGVFILHITNSETRR